MKRNLLHRFPFLSLELAKEILEEEILDFIECSQLQTQMFLQAAVTRGIIGMHRFHLLFGAINQEARVNRCVNDDGY